MQELNEITKQIIPYIQFYLSAILSVNILLASAIAFMIFHFGSKDGFWNTQNIISKFLFIIAFFLVTVALIQIFTSYKDVLDFIIQYETVSAPDITTKLASLDCAYHLDLASMLCSFFALIAWKKSI